MEQPTWIGRTLSGRYKIEALLGQGGMSAVYKASDPNLKRIVAVKLIHPHLSIDPSFVMRFESEASAVASLRHPNIVQVYDFNNDNGVYYMVLEFIPGETLQDRMKRLVDSGRQLAIQDILAYTINICDAVGYAHQRGMVHRDIKPANIMLDVQGHGILMDFGIVKIFGGDSHTTTGAVVGTARYMSPEAIRGEVADHRSDIYSLGVTLFEMLSGRPPFVADSAMTLMMMHLNDPVPNMKSFRTDVPDEIIFILEKALAKNREDRYQSAAEMSADLKRALVNLGGHSTLSRIRDAGKSQPLATQLEARPISQPVSQPAPRPIVQTVVEPAPVTGSRPQPLPPSTRSQATSTTSVKPAGTNRLLWIAGAGLIGILCLAGVVVIGNYFLGGGFGPSSQATQTFSPTTTTSVLIPPIATTASVSETPAVTETPTNTPEPTGTPTPQGPHVAITGIRIDSNVYVVDYEVHNFPDSPTLHVHMFFNTVPPEQAGSPGSGPWKLTWGRYGNPPFTQYGPANRPANATQMCALVANPNHSIIMGTGNCVNLPQ